MSVYIPEKMQLTDKPLTEDYQTALTKLGNGIHYPEPMIEQLPEIKEGRQHIKELGLASLRTDILQGRESIRENVLKTMENYGSIITDENGRPEKDENDKVTYHGEVAQGHRLDIVIGLPASGKSSVITNALSSEVKSMVIDNDDVKALLPEFHNGWGGDAVHEESGMIEKQVFKEMLKTGKNIITPKVGANADKMLMNYILPAKEAGYTVNIHYVDLDTDKACGRMLTRFATEGRWMPPGLVLANIDAETGKNKIDISYETLKNLPLVDGYSHWNNDVPFGEKPILLEKSESIKDKYFETARTEEKKDIYAINRDYTNGSEIKDAMYSFREDEQSLLSSTINGIKEVKNTVTNMFMSKIPEQDMKKYINHSYEKLETLIDNEKDRISQKAAGIRMTEILQENKEIQGIISDLSDRFKDTAEVAKEVIHTCRHITLQSLRSDIDMGEKLSVLQSNSMEAGQTLGRYADRTTQDIAKAMEMVSPMLTQVKSLYEPEKEQKALNDYMIIQ